MTEDVLLTLSLLLVAALTARFLASLARVPEILLLVGLVAYLVFDLSFTGALLLGAVLAPTDPAILIPLFIRSRLRPKLSQTIVAESAFNDPTGAALALALAGVVISGDASVAKPVSEFAADLAVSTVIGVIAGVALAVVLTLLLQALPARRLASRLGLLA